MAVRWSALLTLISRVVRRRSRSGQEPVFGVQWIYRRNGHEEEE